MGFFRPSPSPEGLTLKLNYLYFHPKDCGCDSRELLQHADVTLADSLPDALLSVFAGADGKLDKNLYGYTASRIEKAVNGVFPNVHFGHPLYELQQKLTLNGNRFAAYKADKWQRELDRTRANADGVVRGWDDYKAVAEKVNKKYKAWGRVEEHAATAQARTSRQWSAFEAHKKALPNLRWLPSRAANPRLEHKAFWYKVWAKNHPFWKKNYPGCVWGCMCDWEETADPTEVAGEQVEPSAGLDGNPGITGELFSDSHPYIEATSQRRSAWVEKQLVGLERAEAIEWGKENLKNVRFHLQGKDESISAMISSRGVEEFANQPCSKDFYRYKNQLLYDIEAVCKEAQYLKSDEDIKGNPMVKMYHYFTIQASEKTAYLVVRELKTGEYFLYSCVDKIRQ